MQLLGDLADQKAPRQRTQHNEFGTTRDLVENFRQHEAAENQRGRNQSNNAAHGKQHDADLQIAETRLDCKKQDRKNVLQHQNAERYTPRQRVKFAFLVQHFYDNDG